MKQLPNRSDNGRPEPGKPAGQQNAERSLVRYSAVISALSFVLDMVEGQPEGHVLRSCFIGMRIGERR